MIFWKADAIFDGYQFRSQGELLATLPNGEIVGFVAETEVDPTAIRKMDGWLLPGWVNVHCHLELSHLHQKIPQHTGLVNFILSILQNRHLSNNNIIQEKMQEADAWMFERGVVAVGDVCNTADSIFTKKKSLIQYVNFVEVSGFVPQYATQRWEQATQIRQQFVDAGLNARIVPHAPYSVSTDLLKRIGQSATNEIISIHHQECAAENEFFQHKTGNFLQLYEALNIDLDFFVPTQLNSSAATLPYLNAAKHLLLVHNTVSDETDIEFVQQLSPKAFWCLCANANLYIENQLPAVPLFMKYNLPICIGTDSLASNYVLDVWNEVQSLQHHFNQITIETILQWATINGARALQLENQLGSFEKGKRPGLVQIHQNQSKRLL